MSATAAPAVSDSARSFSEQGPHKLLIGGEWVEAADGQTFETFDPATGDPICAVAQAGAEDVDRAVKAANEAFGRWSGQPAVAREAVMRKLADLLEANADELAELESLDNGKPVTFAK